MVMSKKKNKIGREWSTPLEESKRATVQFAQGLVVSLSVLELIHQLEALEAGGIIIDETYRENLILSLANDVPVGQA
jgi:hypothetical protein